MIVDRAAARIECRGREVVLDALSIGGQAVLELSSGAGWSRIWSTTAGRARCCASRAPATTDAELRLLAASPFDVLRAVAGEFRSETPEEPLTLCLRWRDRVRPCRPVRRAPGQPEDPAGFPRFHLLARRMPDGRRAGADAAAGLHPFGRADDEQTAAQRTISAVRAVRRPRRSAPRRSARCTSRPGRQSEVHDRPRR